MIYVFLAATIFLADFFIKKRIDETRELQEESDVCGGRLILRKYYNKGAALDFLEGNPRLVRLVASGVLLALCGMAALVSGKKGNWGEKLGLSMILGGGASNLYDRVKKGHVVDYFSFKSRFPKVQRVIFNISDLFIFLGSLLFLIFHKEK